MSKLKGWPWDNSPSTLHQWKEVRTGTRTGSGHIALCARCGAYFIERADTRGPVYCFPSQAWLMAHPGDKAAGVDSLGRLCGEFGRPLADR